MALHAVLPAKSAHLHLLHARTHAHAHNHTSRSKHCYAKPSHACQCSQSLAANGCLPPCDASTRTWPCRTGAQMHTFKPQLPRPYQSDAHVPHLTELSSTSCMHSAQAPTPLVPPCSAAARLGRYPHFCPPVKHVCTLQRRRLGYRAATVASATGAQCRHSLAAAGMATRAVPQTCLGLVKHAGKHRQS